MKVTADSKRDPKIFGLVQNLPSLPFYLYLDFSCFPFLFFFLYYNSFFLPRQQQTTAFIKLYTFSIQFYLQSRYYILKLLLTKCLQNRKQRPNNICYYTHNVSCAQSPYFNKTAKEHNNKYT